MRSDGSPTGPLKKPRHSLFTAITLSGMQAAHGRSQVCRVLGLAAGQAPSACKATLQATTWVAVKHSFWMRQQSEWEEQEPGLAVNSFQTAVQPHPACPGQRGSPTTSRNLACRFLLRRPVHLRPAARHRRHLQGIGRVRRPRGRRARRPLRRVSERAPPTAASGPSSPRTGVPRYRERYGSESPRRRGYHAGAGNPPRPAPSLVG